MCLLKFKRKNVNIISAIIIITPIELIGVKVLTVFVNSNKYFELNRGYFTKLEIT